MAHPPAPVIEGTLKSMINSLGFGMITTVLAITFGKFMIPNFFFWIASFVVFIEFVLLSIPRKKEEYELYQAPGRKIMHNVEGARAPQISINSPNEEDSHKKKGIRERFKKDKHGKKDHLSPDAAEGGGGEGSGQNKQTASPKKSPKAEQKAKDEAQKTDKAAEKAEKEKADKSKEKTKGKSDSADNMAEDQDEEKNKNKGKGSWKKRLPHRKSQSLSDE